MNELIKGSKVLIPWSGGLDSTFLVNLAIEKGCHVDVCYFNIEDNANKVHCELNARREMVEYFRNKAHSRGLRFYDNGSIFSFTTGGANNIHPIGRFSQTPLWVLASAYCSREYDYVAMGFVMGDETISWASEYKKLFNSYKKIRSDVDSECKTKLIFPIMRTDKEYIGAVGIPFELRPHIWTCESPNKTTEGVFEACGHCKPCRHHPWQLEAKLPAIDEYTKDDSPMIEKTRKKATSRLKVTEKVESKVH